MTNESDFDLRYRNAHERTAQNHDGVHNGLDDEALKSTRVPVDRVRGAERALNDALAHAGTPAAEFR
jgi:hypothetical protein